MRFFKKFLAGLLAAMTLSAGLAMPVSAEEANPIQPMSYTGEELIARVSQTYTDALALSGYRSFYGRCSTMVNSSVRALGIQTQKYNCHGKNEYEQYEQLERTDCGYAVTRYSAAEYDLAGALNTLSENGTKDVYDIIVCFDGGKTASSNTYGHTLFVHGIVDGMVYFSESYGLELAGRYYSEGAVIVCTIAEFAHYYNLWAYFEGIIHFEIPDETAPELWGAKVMALSEHGFTLSFRASDNVEITELYATVLRYGDSEDQAQRLEIPLFVDAAAVVIRAEDFEDFVGTYYVTLHAADASGNTAEYAVAPEGISLYQATPEQGIYRVTQDNVGIYNAPTIRSNGTLTREGVLIRGDQVEIIGSYVNDQGETWYLLQDGSWVPAEYLRQQQTLWDRVKEILSL